MNRDVRPVTHQTGQIDLTMRGRAQVKNSGGQKAKTIKQAYEKLKPIRNAFVERGKRFSRYTIPHLLVDFDHVGSGDYGDSMNTTGWQSFGASALTHLENRLVMTMFPPHSPFFGTELQQATLIQLQQEAGAVVKAQTLLAAAVKEAMLEHERISGRSALGQAIRHLLAIGNTCLYLPAKGDAVNYPLNRYVVKRDKSGTLLKQILMEHKALDTFPPELQIAIKANRKGGGGRDEDTNIELYTEVKRDGDFFMIRQEAEGLSVGQEYRVHKDRNPFIVLRWEANYGEDYGRSKVELHAGDLHMIQFLSEALAKGMILMADVKYMVKPGSVTDVDHLINSPTGEYVYGNIDDIGVLQLEKYADFTPISAVLDKYEKRVGQAFMMDSQIQRNAERVTAYEIRRDSQSNEQALGGNYTLLAPTLQKPYARLLLNRIGMELTEQHLKITLMTGIEALSKMSELDRIQQFTEMVSMPAAWPQPIQERVDWGAYTQYMSNQLNLTLPFMMTDDQYAEAQQQRQAAQQQQMMSEGLQKAVPTIADNLMSNNGGM
ncbi:head to tail connecting protein [Pseudomonas phage Achelous]|uniref:Head to tail connecting protein n=1 Tax=Pseudomonas phage Achelous TaxID=2163982 RepID=A0A2S1GMU7_9CAUD|nr:head-tail adaptor [Pseudomonas phage Achelous]AWD90707.1 head to tail connecting protein [Pseudomonas phage Achelous]